MKTEIEQILDMHKSGTISSDQAAVLIRELQPPAEPEKSLTEALLDKFAKFTGHLQPKQDGENSNAASHLHAPSGSDFSFRGNRFTTSHVEDLHFHQSSFENNKTVNTHLDKVVLDHSTFEHNTMINTHAEDLKLDDSDIGHFSTHHTELKRLALAGDSSIRQLKIQSSSVVEFNLDHESELSDGEINRSKIRKFRLENSTCMGMTIRHTHFKEVELQNSHLTDIFFTTDRRCYHSDFRQVKFENVFLKKAIFSDCRLENVTFKNITQESVHLSHLHLKDTTIDGDEAFLALTLSKSSP